MQYFYAANCCLAAIITFSITDALKLQALISVFTALIHLSFHRSHPPLVIAAA
jgi:hypothetical protein